ncbi:MAG: tol-pal system YbgF family protein [bacterium]
MNNTEVCVCPMRKFSFPIVLSLFLSFFITSTALARFSQEREERAEKLYKEAIRYEKTGRFREAIENAKQIVENYPSPRYVPNTLLLLGLCYENTYEFKKSLRYYRKVIHGYSSYRIAKIARYKNDLIGKSYRAEKKPLIIFIQQERLIREKKYRESIKKCKRIIRQFPRSKLADNAQNTIGYVYLNYLKKYNQAKLAYRTLLDTYPDSGFRDNAIFAIGRCYERCKLYQSALYTYNKLIKKHKGLLFAKTNYWSRVWSTKASYRIEKIKDVLDNLEKSSSLANFVKPAQKVCVAGENTEDRKAYPILKWVDPKETGRYMGARIKEEKMAFFFRDEEKTALNAWNYIIKNFDLIRQPDDKEWQFPEETISLKNGTERDLSFLMASLLIYLDFKPEHVRVVYGKDSESIVHWWVLADIGGEKYSFSFNWDKEDLHEKLFPAASEQYIPELAFNNKNVLVKPGIPVPFTTCD